MQISWNKILLVASLVAMCFVGTGSDCDINIPPTIIVSHFPLNPTNSQTVMFTATASDTDGEIAEIQILVNAALAKTCTGTTTCTYTGGPYTTKDQSYVSYAANTTDNEGSLATDGYYWFAQGRPWNSKTMIPIRTVGLASSDAIDVCFLMDDDYGGNVSDFQSDIFDKIYDVYFANDWIKPYRAYYNFYYSTKVADADSDCGNISSSIYSAGTYCDAWAVLHASDFRDCTSSNHFTAEGSNTKAFLHESGHGVYGLSDEYEGDTYYFQPNPYPNIWDSLSECQTDATSNGWDSSDCNKYCDDPAYCGTGWWRLGTDTTVMVQGFTTDPWGDPAELRLTWFQGQYVTP